MTTTVCDNNNEILTSIIESLPKNQGGVGRHKCVVCAYHHGVEDGELNNSISNDSEGIEICKHGSFAPTGRIYNIHENQKPSQGRHKCLICAYHIGFNQSIAKLNEALRTNNITFGTLTNKSETTEKINIEPRKKSINPQKVKIDHIKEQRFKTELGLMGEKLVCKYETALGFKVKHSSLEDDSLGYDIESSQKGIKKFIEVKTTTAGINRTFYLSKNELEFLKNNQETLYIYRLYNYNLSTNSADLIIINAKDFLTNYQLDCQSYIISNSY